MQIRLVVGALVALLVLGGWLRWKAGASAVRTDSTTLCAVDRPPSAVTVVLLDVSDEFTEAQRLAVRNELERIRGTIPRLGLVEVYPLRADTGALQAPLLHLCNPGDGADLNRLYQNPTLAKRRWLDFARRLDEKVRRETEQPGLRNSPILEAIQATSLRTFGRPELDGRPKRLVLVSDLIQHVPGGLSMYSQVPPFEVFSRTPYYAQVRASLRDVSVTVLYLARPAVGVQGVDHVLFWEEYLAAQGATVETVERVFGAQ